MEKIQLEMMTVDLVMNLSRICCLHLSRHSKAVNCAASDLSIGEFFTPCLIS